MLTSTTNVARFGTLGARGLQLQSTAFARGGVVAASTCPYSTLVASSLAKNQCTSLPSKPLSSSLRTQRAPSSTPQCCITTTPRRHASSSSTTVTPSNANTNTTSSNPRQQQQQQQQQKQQAPPLDWNTFFRLRKTRRRIQLASSILTTFAGGSVGGMLLVNQDPEWLLGQIPMDPVFSLGLLTMACAGLGWLAGPSLGSALFHLFRRGVKQPMAVKEAEFFARIRKNRVDPTTSSVQNPVPDFYGEKISSVAGYRQWLKDQRAFNKKRTSFV